MTDENIEKLVLLIASGKNTLADIVKTVPIETPDEMDWLIEKDEYDPLDPPNPLAPIRFVEKPQHYLNHRKFDLNDTFCLSEEGENILYRLKKEQAAKQEAAQRHEDEMNINREIKKLTRIGIAATITSIVVAIAIAVITIWIKA